MVQFSATLKQPYDFTQIKDGSATQPSVAFANAQTTGLYLENGTSVGVTSNVAIGECRVVSRDDGDEESVGIQGSGGLDGLRMVHTKAGRAWRSHVVPGGSYYNVIWVEDLGLFMTSASGYVVTSNNGVTWTKRYVGAGSGRMAWSPDLRLLVAVGKNKAWTSPDAVTWTEQTVPAGSWGSVTWAPSANAFVVLEPNKNPAQTMISQDGVSWTLGGSIPARLSQIRSNASTIVSVGADGIYTSTDGMTWTKRYSTSISASIAYGYEIGVWVITGRGTTSLRSADDGVSWTQHTNTAQPETVTWCDRQFIGIGRKGRISTSPDGEKWKDIANIPQTVFFCSDWSPSLKKIVAIRLYGSYCITSTASTHVSVPKGDLVVKGTVTSSSRVVRTVITRIQIADSSYTPIDDTAVPSDTSGYLVISGRDFQTSGTTRAEIGGTPVTAISVVDSSTIRIQTPSKPSGTYALRLVYPDGSTTSIPDAVTFSTAPVWATTDSLLTTTANGMPFDVIVASSDSTLTLATTNVSLPTGTQLVAEDNVVTFSGTIGPPRTTVDTVFAFDASVQDLEQQNLDTKSWTVQYAATYHSPYIGNAVVQSLQTAAQSSTVDANADTIVDTIGSVVSPASASASSAYTAAGYVLDSDIATAWTTQAVYDDGVYNGSVSTTVSGQGIQGETLDLLLEQATAVSHVVLRPLTVDAAPVSWTLAGSLDGVSWTHVYTQTASLPWSTSADTIVAVASPVAYSRYRIIVQTVSSGQTSASIATVGLWTGGLPGVGYTYPISIPGGTIMAKVGSTVVHIDPALATAKTLAVGLGLTATPALLADGSVFWPPYVGSTVGYRVGVDGIVATVSGIAADVSHARTQADGTVLMLPSVGTTAQTYDPSSGAVGNVTYALPGSKAVGEAMAVPRGILALPDAGGSGSRVTDGVVTSTVALFGDNYNESKLVASDGEVSAQFGWSMSMNAAGTRLVVGAGYNNASGGFRSGAAYVFSLVDGVWAQDTKLVPADSEAVAIFGNSVSMNASGNRLVVGATLDNATGGGDSGAAYVFSLLDGEGVRDVKLVPFDSEVTARFGNSVSMNASGDRLVVGAHLDNATGGVDSGAAYVFSLVDGTWVEDAKFVPSDSEEFANFGISTSMNASGDRLVVGAYLDDATGGSNSGAAYVFSLVDGTWVEDAKLVPSDSEENALFGQSTSMNASGDRLVVGAVYDTATGGYRNGAAYVFSLVDGEWVEDAKIVPSDSEMEARFGWSTSMNGTGTRLVVGASEDNATGGTDSGAAYVFSLVNGEWIEDMKIVPTDSEGSARFGHSTSMNASGDRVVVGAYLDNSNDLNDSGAAYVYDLSSAGRVDVTGSALIAKGSTIRSYDLDTDTVTGSYYLPNGVSDLTPLADGRVLATSSHATAMVLDPVSGTVSTVDGSRSLGRSTLMADGRAWTESGHIFVPGSASSVPLTQTIQLCPHLNP